MRGKNGEYNRFIAVINHNRNRHSNCDMGRTLRI